MPLYDPVISLRSRVAVFNSRLLKEAAVAPGESVLDLACGTGTLAVAIKRAVPTAVVSALDADRSILRRAIEKARRAEVEVGFTEAMSTELPYNARTFDLVVSSLFFHHLTDEAKADTAEEIRRVLKPGGRLLVADWGRPQDPLMRLAFLNIQILDGFRTTGSNVRGKLPEILREGRLKKVSVVDRLRTPLGTIEIVSASRPKS
jgi:ubiquinone/menaquinone biosynthesis C-methylase UbiE